MHPKRGTTAPLFYADVLGLASAELTETSSSGSGGILNVEEGSLDMTLRSPQGLCGEELMFHYLSDSDGVIPIPIRAGFTTAIDVQCPQ